jgi:hypothetical protein
MIKIDLRYPELLTKWEGIHEAQKEWGVNHTTFSQWDEYEAKMLDIS